MSEKDDYIREEKNILTRKSSDTKYTVRLHFTQNDTDDAILEEIQKILTETYIRHLRAEGKDLCE